ncbi:MAG TPA: histidine kinase [Rhizomicrobium sp.]|jgi:two-component system sensor histidine kinase UhpB
MSLRFRLLACVVGVLLAALIAGGVLACWQARKSVRVELDAALASGVLMVHESLAISGNKPAPAYIDLLVRSFDGERHIRATLLRPDGTTGARSQLAPSAVSVPGWFDALIGVSSRTIRIPLATNHADASRPILLLTTEPQNEIGEVWNQTRDAVAIMFLFCGGTFVFVYLLIGRALQSLSSLEAGFRTISEGNYEADVPERGSREFWALAHGFNQMTNRLRSYGQRNAQLQEQLVRLQEEERAWIARDLHDEVGPYLFAIGVDTAAIPDLIETKKSSDAIDRAAAIREAVAHIQKHIKAILRQLRPVEHLDFGLDAAVRDLIAFWQRRYPEIHFDLDIRLNGADVPRNVEEVIFRVVRESIGNAVRHGRPENIGVSILCLEFTRVAVEIVDDGDGLPAGPLQMGMGLDGMAARIHALDGEFGAGPRMSGRGVRVAATLPLQALESRVTARAI